MKPTYLSILSAILLLGIIPAFASKPSMKETELRITKECPITPSTTIRFTNKEGILTVKTWNQDKVSLETHLIIDGKEDAVADVIKAISAIDFTTPSGEAVFNTKYYQSYAQFFPGSTKIVLLDGKTVKGITKLKCRYTLMVPATNPMIITQKYEDIELPDLRGTLTLQLYECDLTAGNLSNEVKLSLKYGKATVASTKTLTLSLYESSATIGQTTDLNLTSKYSHLAIKQTGNIVFDCYEDQVEILSHGTIRGKAKYTTLALADFEQGTLDFYETKLKAGRAGTVEVNAKYCILEFLTINQITFQESYENQFIGPVVGSIRATSKYSHFSIGTLQNELSFSSSYEDDIFITRLAHTFTGITLTSKYSDLNITAEKEAKYKLDADLVYTDLSLPASNLKELRYHKDNNTFLYQGIIPQADPSTCPVIRINMYEGSVILQ